MQHFISRQLLPIFARASKNQQNFAPKFAKKHTRTVEWSKFVVEVKITDKIEFSTTSKTVIFLMTILTNSEKNADICC